MRSCGVVLARSFFAAARRIAVEIMSILLAERSPHPARIGRCYASPSANDPPPPGEGAVERNLKENRKYLHLEVALVSSLGFHALGMTEGCLPVTAGGLGL